MSLIDEAALVNAFENVPVIDVTNIYSTDPVLRKELVSQIREACIRVGFFYVSNHGIPEAIIRDARNGAERFFALPLETKMEMENKKQPNFKGYTPLLGGNNDPYGAGDLQEGFEFGFELLKPEVQDDGNSGVMAGPNVWPPNDEDFRSSSLTYYHAAANLGRALFPLFAEALDQSPGFFDDKTQHSAAIMKLLHYPPQTGPINERVIGIGAHTDWECFTILWQEPNIQALQVLNSEKQWIDAPSIDGTLVINLGDMFARITNGVFKATVHRAINRNGVERYSIPLFFGIDYDTRLEPMPNCVSSERPFEYDIITAGEYVHSRLQATYYMHDGKAS